MTRERAKEIAPLIVAYGEGKQMQYGGDGKGEWIDCRDGAYPAFTPWDDCLKYRIKPEPKKRLMTRDEVLGFVAHNPHIVVRIHSLAWLPSLNWVYPDSDINEYEWATITERGEIGEPHKFEVDDD